MDLQLARGPQLQQLGLRRHVLFNFTGGQAAQNTPMAVYAALEALRLQTDSDEERLAKIISDLDMLRTHSEAVDLERKMLEEEERIHMRRLERLELLMQLRALQEAQPWASQQAMKYSNREIVHTSEGVSEFEAEIVEKLNLWCGETSCWNTGKKVIDAFKDSPLWAKWAAASNNPRRSVTSNASDSTRERSMRLTNH